MRSIRRCAPRRTITAKGSVPLLKDVKLFLWDSKSFGKVIFEVTMHRRRHAEIVFFPNEEFANVNTS